MKTTFVGAELKRIRKSLGLTQAEMTLNGKIISIGQYSKVENGIHEIGVDTLLKILTAHDEINVQTFFINLEKNYTKVDNEFSPEILSEKLMLAFYKNDLLEAQKLKKQIDNLKENKELKLRAVITVAVLSGTILNLDEKTKEDLSKNMFINDNWTKEKDSLRLFSNSMIIIDRNILPTLMKSVLRTYSDEGRLSVEVQERISSICINYLYVCFKKHVLNNVEETIAFLKKLSESPSLMFNKILGYYFECLFNGNDSDASKIRDILAKSECNQFLNKLIS
ncbi:helix-turn-helix domain-containing protein [uncultured Lactobacillus sp.]|uniref:helix-turn-helix domain-containing protein n=1 Tax=uncultured Lactobacillus sp. TaxID=153152 RepID=UPI00258B3B8C|nr:helix-turn-helix domain-containing protein [uncultured Lactobacillus sp.]